MITVTTRERSPEKAPEQPPRRSPGPKETQPSLTDRIIQNEAVPDGMTTKQLDAERARVSKLTKEEKASLFKRMQDALKTKLRMHADAKRALKLLSSDLEESKNKEADSYAAYKESRGYKTGTVIATLGIPLLIYGAYRLSKKVLGVEKDSFMGKVFKYTMIGTIAAFFATRLSPAAQGTSNAAKREKKKEDKPDQTTGGARATNNNGAAGTGPGPGPGPSPAVVAGAGAGSAAAAATASAGANNGAPAQQPQAGGGGTNTQPAPSTTQPAPNTTQPAPAAPTLSPREKLFAEIDTDGDGTINKAEGDKLLESSALKGDMLALGAGDREIMLLKFIEGDDSGELVDKLAKASHHWKGYFIHGFVVSGLAGSGLTESEGRALLGVFRSLRSQGKLQPYDIVETAKTMKENAL